MVVPTGLRRGDLKLCTWKINKSAKCAPLTARILFFAAKEKERVQNKESTEHLMSGYKVQGV